MGTPSPEFKQLWIRVLKRVHPDLAIDEHDRVRCERLTKLANEAYQAGDVEALRAVLRPPPTSYAVRSRAVTRSPRWRPAPASPAEEPKVQQASPASSIAPHPGIAFSFKQVLGVATAVVILVGGGLSLYSVTSSGHAVTNSPTARPASMKDPVEVADAQIRHPPPSKWYRDVIHNRISRNLNPSTVDTPAGATAVIAFAISPQGSPQKVSLFTTSGYPSLDSSCVNAVRQVVTFGPPEGGTTDSLSVIYDCSYQAQNGQPAPQKTSPSVAIVAQPSHLYMKQMSERLYQSFSDDERVDANVPAGNSAELWFDVNRDGSLSNVRIGKPSGWSSLDYACMRAVQRTETVGALPEDYKLRTLPASFACSYNGSNALPTSDRPGLYVGSVRNPPHE